MINKKQKKLIQAFLQPTHLNQPYPVSIKQEVRVHTASMLQQRTKEVYSQPVCSNLVFCQPDIVQGLKPLIIYTLTQYVFELVCFTGAVPSWYEIFKRDPIPISCWYGIFLRDPKPIPCWYDFVSERSNTKYHAGMKF
jgi:hypothetical protein